MMAVGDVTAPSLSVTESPSDFESQSRHRADFQPVCDLSVWPLVRSDQRLDADKLLENSRWKNMFKCCFFEK